MTLFLIDSSHYQASLPVSTLAGQGFVGVILKATEDTGFKDSQFPTWLAQTRASGRLLVAAYHFLHEGSLAQQAALTRSVVPPEIPVWVDVERTVKPDGTVSNPTREDAYAYADALRARGGTVAGIYHGAQPKPGYGGWWRAAYGSDPTGSASYAYAANGGDTSHYWDAGTTRHPQIWQFCQHGRIAGFSGDVDLNAYRGTLQQLVDTGWFWVPDALKEDTVLSDADKEYLKELVPQPAYLERMVDLHAAAAVRNTIGGPVAAILAAIAKADVDEPQLAADMAPLLAQLLPGQIVHLSAEDLQAVAVAVNDELARRAAS